MTKDQLRTALQAHRLERGLSFEQLAAAIGPERVTSHTLRRFIKLNGNPNELTIYAIEAYLARQTPEAMAS